MNLCQNIYTLTQDVFFCGQEIEGVIFETFDWDYTNVAISIAICILYSSIACEMYARNISSHQTNFFNIVKTGSIYGLGIFSMHFMGMFAFGYPGPMNYDVIITIFSLLIAISGVSLTLYLMQQATSIFISSVIFGLSVCMMHYAGMLSITSNPYHMHHNLNYMIMAIVYSIFGSFFSLKFITQYLKNRHVYKKRILFFGSVAMGITISGMHYLAMISLEFSVAKDLNELPHDWFIDRNSIVASTLIILIATISAYIKDSMKAEYKIQKSQDELELQNTNISNTLKTVKTMQSQLVEAEKMASLGQLVSGVAHEINTPIGIAITSSSYLKDQSNIFFNRFKDGTITKTDFEKFMIDVNSGADLLTSNLNKASALIKNFKQVAVDQTIDEIREFQLKQYILEVLTSLNHKIKKTNFKLIIICKNEVLVRTYAGSISAIITHLFNNSLIHGFEHMTEGTITIKIDDMGDSASITYCDTGCGIPSIDIEKVTSPFYTTKRGGDCSGLGMYIVYNQATQRLCGKLSYRSLNALPINTLNSDIDNESPHGLEVEITFPKYL